MYARAIVISGQLRGHSIGAHAADDRTDDQKATHKIEKFHVSSLPSGQCPQSVYGALFFFRISGNTVRAHVGPYISVIFDSVNCYGTDVFV